MRGKRGVVNHPHVVRIRTALSVNQLELWFSANCKGDWSITVEDAPAGATRRTVAVHFEDFDEEQAFEQAYKNLERPPGSSAD